MSPNLNNEQIEVLGSFSEENTNEWVGIALKGLQNRNELLLGKRYPLLLDYFGFEITFINEALVKPEIIIPSIKSSNKIFIPKENNFKNLHLKIRCPFLTEFSELNNETLKLDPISFLKDISTLSFFEIKVVIESNRKFDIYINEQKIYSFL
jgi:hypothetical protein